MRSMLLTARVMRSVTAKGFNFRRPVISTIIALFYCMYVMIAVSFAACWDLVVMVYASVLWSAKAVFVSSTRKKEETS